MGQANHFGRCKYFDTIEECRDWLRSNEGGTIKQRNGLTLYSRGYGLGRVVFDPPVKVWSEIEEVAP